MSVDVREQILARLVEIVATVPNVRTAHRNAVDIHDDQLPAGNVLDGDEEGDIDLTHQPNSSTAIRMTPEIVIMKQSDQIGSDLTAFRLELIRLVTNDAELIQIVNAGRGGTGAIRYVGCETKIGWLEKWYGAIEARFVFKYWLKPNEL